MAFGDMLTQLRVPEKPATSSMTDQAYIDAVTAGVDAHLITTGIKAAMPDWANRTDLPDSEAGAIGFVDARLSAAGVNTSLYAYSLLNKADPVPVTVYCVDSGIMRCYGTVRVVPKLSTTPNIFQVDVSIDNGLSVAVVMNFVVRPLLTFPT